MQATRIGNYHLVLYFAQKGAKIGLRDMEGQTPYLIACRCGYLDIVKYFAKKNIDVNIKDSYGHTAVLLSTRHRNYNVTSFLLTLKGIDVKAKEEMEKKTAVIFAAQNGDKDIVDLLVAHGASLNVKDKSGKSAKDYLAELKPKE